MVNTRITLITKNAVDIRGEFATTDPADLNQLTRGESVSLTLHLGTDDLVVSGSYTVESGAVEQYDEIVVESGATLTINGELYGNTLDNDGTVDNNGTLTLYGGVFDKLQQYTDWAGKYATQTTINGVEKYREQIPSTADVSSIVLGIEPSQDLQNEDIQGTWMILDSGTDKRNRPLSTDQYQLQGTVLAELNEYADHAAIEADLEI